MKRISSLLVMALVCGGLATAQPQQGPNSQRRCCDLDEAYHAFQVGVPKIINADQGPIQLIGNLYIDGTGQTETPGIKLNNAGVHGAPRVNLYSHGAETDVNNGIVFWNQPPNDDAKVLLSLGPDGLVQIGPGGGVTGTPSNPRLSVFGDACKPGGGSWSSCSDLRLKSDIHPFAGGLDILRAINPIRYKYNGKAGMPTDKEYIGVIAQELRKIAPYTVSIVNMKIEPSDAAETEVLMFDPSALMYIAVNAIKELDAKVSELKQLSEDYADLSSRLSKLEDARTNPLTNVASVASQLTETEK